MFYFSFRLSLSQLRYLVVLGGGCYLGEGVIDTKISGFTTQHKKSQLKMIRRRGKKRYNPKIGKLVCVCVCVCDWVFLWELSVILLGLLFVIVCVIWRCLNGRRWW